MFSYRNPNPNGTSARKHYSFLLYRRYFWNVHCIMFKKVPCACVITLQNGISCSPARKELLLPVRALSGGCDTILRLSHHKLQLKWDWKCKVNMGHIDLVGLYRLCFRNMWDLQDCASFEPPSFLYILSHLVWRKTTIFCQTLSYSGQTEEIKWKMRTNVP